MSVTEIRPGRGLIERYIEDCKRRNLSVNTIWARSHLLKKVQREVGLFDATPEQLGAWLDRELEPSSKATYLATLRHFYEWAAENGGQPGNPARRVAVPRQASREPQPISVEDLRRAIEAGDAKMRAWLLLGAAAGLRCCEIAMVWREDVHLEQPPWLFVRAGKGAKERNVPMHPLVAEALTELPTMTRMGRLFPTAGARSVSEAINRHLRSVGSQASAHKLRHYAATEYWKALNEAGTPDLLTLMDFLGHSNPETSMRYTKRDQSKGVRAMAHMEVPDVE